jgi:hypothetical protein
MTTSEYVNHAIYRQREQEMNLRNERRRVALERHAIRSTTRRTRTRTRRGLSYVVRHRLAELFSDAPAHG